MRLILDNLSETATQFFGLLLNTVLSWFRLQALWPHLVDMRGTGVDVRESELVVPFRASASAAIRRDSNDVRSIRIPYASLLNDCTRIAGPHIPNANCLIGISRHQPAAVGTKRQTGDVAFASAKNGTEFTVSCIPTACRHKWWSLFRVQKKGLYRLYVITPIHPKT
jgi:hypothetical protein